MKSIFKMLMILTVTMLIGCSNVFAANTDINFSLQCKNPLQSSDMLRVTVDGKYLCSLSDAEISTFQVNSGVNIEHKPYDIIIEYIKRWTNYVIPVQRI